MTFILPPIRGNDRWGRGYFGASRDGGKRAHNGTDFVATPGEPVRAFMAGTVSKLGYPYKHDLSLRYVEVRRDNGDLVRYFYVQPTVALGAPVKPGDSLGFCQKLPYEGITQHYHCEVLINGEYADPARYLSDYA